MQRSHPVKNNTNKHLMKTIKYIAKYLIIFCLVLEATAYLDSAISAFLTPPRFSSLQRRDALGVKGVKYGTWKSFKLNKYGFNDSDDYYMNHKKHAVRIMCIGDSIAF